MEKNPEVCSSLKPFFSAYIGNVKEGKADNSYSDIFRDKMLNSRIHDDSYGSNPKNEQIL